MSVFTAIITATIVMSVPSPYRSAPARTLPGMLPAYRTPLLQKTSPGQINAFRLDHPKLFGVTEPPPEGFRMYAEFGPVDAMYITYEDMLRDYFVSVIGSATAGTEVYIVVSGQQMQNQVDNVLTTELSSDAYQHIHYVDVSSYPFFYSPIYTIWMVDYGPFFVKNASDEVAVVDPRYYAERVDDDALPAKLADILGMTDYRTDLNIEGGNLISDGEGTCYTSTMLLQENPERSQEEIEQVLDNYFGCEKVAWLTPLAGEGTGHVDMFFVLASPTTVLVGSYEPSQDSQNAQILDDDAQFLEGFTTAAGSSLQVLRIPMPDKGWDNTYQDHVWRTYTNGLRLNDVYLMPVYAEESTHEASAIEVLQQALGSVQIIGVPSDDIITWAGAIHCTTRTKPVGTAYEPASPPAYVCDGRYECNCTDECTTGESRCVDDDTREVCGQDDDDLCLEWIQMACPSGETCSDGVCGSCSDECNYGDYGCSDENTVSRCSEAGDGDACTEEVTMPCPSGRQCSYGLCLPPDNAGCGNVDFVGECQGDYMVYCQDGQLSVVDCRQYGGVCGWSENDDYYDCIEGSPCTDDCTAGEVRCSDDGASVQACTGDVFTGCLSWNTVAQCDNGCHDGTCLTDDGTGTGNGTDDDGTGTGSGTDTGSGTNTDSSDDGSSNGGCGCSTPGTSGSSVPWFMFVVSALMVTIMRRKNRIE